MNTDVKADGPYDGLISLAKLVQQPVVDVVGYLSNEYGGIAFKITHLKVASGDFICVEGEHDFPYITDSSDTNDELDKFLSEEYLQELDEELEKSGTHDS